MTGLSDLSSRVRRHLRALGFDSVDRYRAWCTASGFAAGTNKNQHQMKEELRRHAADASSGRLEESLAAHVRSLGFRSTDDYRSWCRKHGLGDGVHKSRAQRAKEAALRRTEGNSDDLAKSRALRRDLASTFSAIARGSIRSRALTDPLLKRLSALLQRERDAGVRGSFLELLMRLDAEGQLDVSPVIEHLGTAEGNSAIDFALALAARRDRWCRDVRSFHPRSHARRQILGELARHLLARYEVPAFMDAAWFSGTGEPARLEQEWFIHVGRGGNIRTAPGLPMRLTRRMAHLFPRAPVELSITQALRWAQVAGAGGDRELGDRIVATRLGETIEHDEFWATVVHWFVNHEMIDPDQIGPIVDFIHHRRFVAVEQHLPDGVVVAPREPGFSMKGRRPERLLELVERWHEELAREKPRRARAWPASGYRPFEKRVAVEDGEAVWRINELTSRQAIIDEGRAMHHCVATYNEYCARGQKSVWSLMLEDRGQVERVMTIAVNNRSGRVVQARGRCNALPGIRPKDRAAARVLAAEAELLARGREVMREWAERESITVPRVT